MELPNGSYETLSEAMNKLKEKGFNYEFDFKDAHLCCATDNREYGSDELKIVEIHRFEGITDPEDSSILYAVESNDGAKGLVVDAYGMYADAEKTKFMSSVEIAEHNMDPENKTNF
jgi:hypothetical protein|nr:phosphoribosylpyrophosphate synthetase [uncultured Pedobacter sp.]